MIACWKFGGACFSDHARTLAVARRIAERPAGRDLVVVV
jgi:aspartokinase